MAFLTHTERKNKNVIVPLQMARLMIVCRKTEIEIIRSERILFYLVN